MKKYSIQVFDTYDFDEILKYSQREDIKAYLQNPSEFDEIIADDVIEIYEHDEEIVVQTRTKKQYLESLYEQGYCIVFVKETQCQ